MKRGLFKRTRRGHSVKSWEGGTPTYTQVQETGHAHEQVGQDGQSGQGGQSGQSGVFYQAHRRQHPKRHKLGVTLIGDAGRPYRIALMAGTVLLLAIILAVALSGGSDEPQFLAEPEIEILQSSGVVKVGVRENIVGMSNNGAGLEIELSQLLSERLLPGVSGGNAVQYVTVTSHTAEPRITDGTITIAAAMMQKDALSSLLYSDPYYSDACRFVIRSGETVTASNITVGCLQESPEQAMLKTYIEERPASNIAERPFASYPDMLGALLLGKVDAVVMSDVMIDVYDSEYDIDPTGLELGSIDYAFACTTDAPAVIEAANIMIKELAESGELDAIAAKYGLG